MSTLQDLKNAGNTIMEFDYKMSAYDSDGGHAPTYNSVPYFNRNGLNFDGTGDNITYSVSGELNTTAISFVYEFMPDFETDENAVRFFFDSTSPNRYLLAKNNNAGSNTLLLWLGQTAIVDIAEGTYSPFWKKGERNVIFVTSDSDTDLTNIWLNGNQIVTDDSTAWTPNDPDSIFLNSTAANASTFDGTTMYFGIFNKVFTATEIAQIDGELSNRIVPTKPYAKAKATIEANISETGLVSEWAGLVNGSTLVDRAGSNDGTITGSIPTRSNLLGTAMTFDGVAKASLTTTGWDIGEGTFMFWADKNDWDPGTNQFILNGETSANVNEIKIGFDATDKVNYTYRLNTSGGNTVTLSHDVSGFADTTKHHFAFEWKAADFSKLYIDGELVESDETITFTPTALASTFMLGTDADGNLGYEGDLYDPRLYTTTGGTTIADAYREGARTAQYKTDWGVTESPANVTAGYLENSGWQVSTGTWKVLTDTINGQKAKVFDCVSSGILYIPIDQFMTPAEAAFGTWEFWLNHADTSTTDVHFIDNTLTFGAGSSYKLVIVNTESVSMAETGVAAHFNTAAGAVAAGTWLKVKITRSAAGVFTTYIDDVLLSTAGGSGSNPFTDTTLAASNFIALDFDTGDKFAISDVTGDNSFIKYLGIV